MRLEGLSNYYFFILQSIITRFIVTNAITKPVDLISFQRFRN